MKWYELFCQGVKPWTLQFFTDHIDLLQVAKTSPNYKLTLIATGHCKLNSFLCRINKSNCSAWDCSDKETLNHYLFECKLFENERTEMQFKLQEFSDSDIFNINVIWSIKEARYAVLAYLNRKKRLDIF
jgi:hypothetical protein